jgi:hypothetical protein
VQNGVVVHLLQAQANLLQLLHSFSLSKLLSLFDKAKEVAAVHLFHDYVKISRIVEKTIKFDDIGMIQKHLNFNLVYELLQHVFYLLFGDLLERHQHASRLVDRKKDLPKRPLTLALPYFEVVERYLMLGRRQSGRGRGRGGRVSIDMVITSAGLDSQVFLDVELIKRFYIGVLLIAGSLLHLGSNKVIPDCLATSIAVRYLMLLFLSLIDYLFG